MKRLFTLLAMILLTGLASANANLRANLSFSSFWSPQDGPFVETYLSVDAGSIRLVPSGEGWQGSVEITMIFKQGETVANFNKYELKSPLINDTNEVDFNFLDQQRYSLDNGEYTFEISIRDKNSGMDAVTHSQPIRVDFPEGEVSLSGIQLLESFSRSQTTGILTKSGYDLIPYVFNFYPDHLDKISWYTEIYGTESLGMDYGFLVFNYIESSETGEVIKDLQRIQKKTSAPVIPLLQEFDISRLPSGNFRLVTEVRNQQNEVIGSNSLFFQRINPDVQLELGDIAAIDVAPTFAATIADIDTLAEYIRCLNPISSEMERVFAEKHLQSADLLLMQQYFVNFWLVRDPVNPQLAWQYYHEKVRHVDEHFSTLIRKGYETDRGIVYLKYGPPNTITESHHEPAAWPYEIWHYYQLKNQTNRKFVFASRDLATNDFDLLHSDAIGEISNSRWQIEVMRRTEDNFNLDETKSSDHWGGRIETFYRNPR